MLSRLYALYITKVVAEIAMRPSHDIFEWQFKPDTYEIAIHSRTCANTRVGPTLPEIALGATTPLKPQTVEGTFINFRTQ